MEKETKKHETKSRKRVNNDNNVCDIGDESVPRRRSARLIAISKPKFGQVAPIGEKETDFINDDEIEIDEERQMESGRNGQRNGVLLKNSSYAGLLPAGSNSDPKFTRGPISSLLRSLKTNLPDKNPIPVLNCTPSTNSNQPVSENIRMVSKDKIDSSTSSDEDEWEEMDAVHPRKDERHGTVEVHLAGEAAKMFRPHMNPFEVQNATEAKERAKWEHWVKLEIARKRRELQEDLHRIHILANIGHLRFMICALISSREKIVEKITTLFGAVDSALPLTPIQMEKNLKQVFLAKLHYHGGKIQSKRPLKWCTRVNDVAEHLAALIDGQGFCSSLEASLIFFAYCSFVLGPPTRLCLAFTPITRLMDEPKKTSKKLKKEENAEGLNGTEGKNKAKLRPTNDDRESCDESAEEDKTIKKRRKKANIVHVKDTKNEAEDEEGINYWNEYWDEQERRWICVNPMHGCVDSSEEIEPRLRRGTKMLYVLAIDNDGGVREIASKYAHEYLSLETRKLRTDGEWIQKTLAYKFLLANECRARLEDAEIHKQLRAKPIPTKLAEFKNHPLYALKKDLLKYEAIYPPDCVPMGHNGKQKYEIFPRSAIHKLEGSLNWIKEARSIKVGEKPYKVVKARPKLNVPKERREQLTLDLFGYWQTEPYVPGEVVDGRIPRNEFGNIYMYKSDMLPKGCVHIRLPGIFQVARRLDLEAVPAVVGWEFSGGFNHPILDGCVVLGKDEEVLRSAWQEAARNKAAKEAKRTEERVWKNWRRLIRGKILLEQMRKRFK